MVFGRPPDPVPPPGSSRPHAGLQRDPADDLYELISERVGRSLAITANRAASDWYSLFPNPVVAESILDRVVNVDLPTPTGPWRTIDSQASTKRRQARSRITAAGISRVARRSQSARWWPPTRGGAPQAPLQGGRLPAGDLVVAQHLEDVQVASPPAWVWPGEPRVSSTPDRARVLRLVSSWGRRVTMPAPGTAGRDRAGGRGRGHRLDRATSASVPAARMPLTVRSDASPGASARAQAASRRSAL